MAEWDLRHVPISFWERRTHLENLDFVYDWLKATLKGIGLYERGHKNALDVCIKYKDFYFDCLPTGFDGIKILFMTDLHIDGMNSLCNVVVKKIRNLKVDICLLGGDFRFQMHGPIRPALTKLEKIISFIQAPLGNYTVLGNHDTGEMIPDLEDMGIKVLQYKSVAIKNREDKIWLIGVDDPHYYKCHDMHKAFQTVPEDAFKIFLAHSPDLYEQTAARNANLYLCGHTHNGQIRFPVLGAIIKHSSAPKKFIGGPWQYKAMLGYTGAGVGSSGTTVRFLCPPEITVLCLKRRI